MSRVNLGMGGSKKKSSPKKKAMKSKGSAQGVKMKSKGGAMGGKKEMMPGGMKNGGGLEMTTVGGKKVPKFAADGKGAKDLMKKAKGGAVKKAKGGALMKKKKPMGE